MTRSPRLRLRAGLAVLAAVAVAAPAAARPTEYRPGFNLFSPQQDVEIGRQSAVEAERQLPLLRDRGVDRYLEDLVQRLSRHAPGAQYPYQVKAVDAADVNAFALPGGFLYVNRGTIEAASSEAELAGVLAHEMAHVALRHGTHQASRAYLAQAGLAVLGGAIAGRKGGSTGQIFSVLGGLGLNALFLRYSRDAETQADVTGVQILSAAGYDPESMATFFDKLQRLQRSQPRRLAQFLSDHPAPADRAARIRREARELSPGPRTASVGGFEQVKSALRSLGPAAGANAPLRRAAGAEDRGSTRGTSVPGDLRIEPPSARFRSFSPRGGLFSIELPENWQVAESDNGQGATLVPPGGVVETPDGKQALACGVIVNHYDPFDERNATGPLTLARATDDIVQQIRSSNPHLTEATPMQRASLGGERALSVALSGRSPATGRPEQVTLYTSALSDEHVIYALFVTPGDERGALAPAFTRMLESLRVDERAAHR